jgi:hypothetical protein
MLLLNRMRHVRLQVLYYKLELIYPKIAIVRIIEPTFCSKKNLSVSVLTKFGFVSFFFFLFLVLMNNWMFTLPLFIGFYTIKKQKLPLPELK